MPIYEYQCNECNHVEEIFQKEMKNLTFDGCPNCDAKNTMSRKVSRTSFAISGDAKYKKLDVAETTAFRENDDGTAAIATGKLPIEMLMDGEPMGPYNTKEKITKITE